MIPTENEMNKAFEMRHGTNLFNKLKNTTVAVCGLGGLGSNVSISLARMGIGKLILVDFDEVDVTNLHRQQYKTNRHWWTSYTKPCWHSTKQSSLSSS